MAQFIERVVIKKEKRKKKKRKVVQQFLVCGQVLRRKFQDCGPNLLREFL